jgi:hypothetical protein
MASSRWHYADKTTGLSGVKYGMSGVKSLQRQWSPAVSGQRLGAPDKNSALSGAPPDCPVCRREQQLFSNGYNCVGGYKYTPTGHSQV